MHLRLTKELICICLLCTSAKAIAQKESHPFIYFPAISEKSIETSIGVSFMTTPKAITEEVHTRIPAGDFTLIKRLGKKTSINSRIRFQILQNELSLGFKYIKPLNQNISVSIGNDFAGWMGWLKFEGFNSRGFGFLDYPNASIGYKIDKEIWLTLKTELQLNTFQKLYAGTNSISKTSQLLSGEALTLVLEQPFYKQKYLSLGFRALYTDFYWQTWALYPTFERDIFYPEIFIGFIL